MFNLMNDGKLRGSNLAYERPLCARTGRSEKSAFDPERASAAPLWR
jgi:hypothetical protein